MGICSLGEISVLLAFAEVRRNWFLETLQSWDVSLLWQLRISVEMSRTSRVLAGLEPWRGMGFSHGLLRGFSSAGGSKGLRGRYRSPSKEYTSRAETGEMTEDPERFPAMRVQHAEMILEQAGEGLAAAG